MDVIDLAVAADWEFDADFVRLVGEAAVREGLTTRAIWPADFGETVRRLAAGEMGIRFLLDRASATSPEFLVPGVPDVLVANAASRIASFARDRLAPGDRLNLNRRGGT